MQLIPTPADPVSSIAPSGNSLGIDTVASRLQAFTAQLAATANERAHHEREWREQRDRVRRDGVRAQERSTAEAASEADPLAALPQLISDLHALRDRRLALVAAAGLRGRQHLREQLEQQVAAAGATRDEAARNVPASPSMLAESARVEQQRTAFLEAIAEQRSRLAKIDEQFLVACRQAGTYQRDLAVQRTAHALPQAVGKAQRQLKDLRAAIDTGSATAAVVHSGSACADTRPLGIILNHGVIALPHLIALAVFPLLDLTTYMWWVGLSGACTQALVPWFTKRQRRQLSLQLGELRATVTALTELTMRTERAGREEYDPQGPLQQRLNRILRLDEAHEAAVAKLNAASARTVAGSKQREQRLKERLAARCTACTAQARRELTLRSTTRQSRTQAAVAALAGTQQQQEAALEQAWAEARARLDERWVDTVAAAQAYAAELSARSAARHPAWSAPKWASWTPPTEFATEIPLGSARLSLTALAALATSGGTQGLPVPADATLEVPVDLAFPSPASLLIRTGPDGRTAALQLVNHVLLRALAAFPAGRLRLTLIDPVGLGEAFSDFLELADHEDSLLGRGVLNEAGAIEQGLADLIAHTEMVIQKHLRGRYATIVDYNREAGEMQEALHMVVVADFPAGFTERAVERLAILARSGARCGVHLLLLHDDRRTLPAALDLAWFRRTGVVLRDLQGRLVIDREGLADWEFRAQPLPPADVPPRLIAAIGRAAATAQRVEVPFAAVTPTAAERWSLSSAKQLRIPIGKRGADRLQYFDVGRGTAQHALIGGRTGSGKSTLFHVLITSAALWYAPSELEFHLIDFKKGVEFKSFATQRLPHARIIAIESDREFGLSVLRNLDLELARRGDAFRAVGAQDLAAHRSSGGEHLPRILLLIDEFQEFFTEDDAIARDAALLLDRFVRQGRAFGLHVMLGSQTLGGSYSLAKSSLGQMGIRIALPCNESDAHLLLHEDNDATRLLIRPGDAVYNDHAGLSEGNSPFQVCWLSDDQEVGHLQAIAAQAAATQWKAQRPTVIFEGNGPSRLPDDPGLAELLARPAVPSDVRMRAVVGQSSSLKGPAEVVFPTAAGGNLLIIGQNREAAAATCGALLVGLAARHAPGALRLVALDGEDRDSPFALLHDQLTQHLPHAPERHEARGLVALLTELDELLERRQSGAGTGTGTGIDLSPVVLTVFALQRLRQLRPDDDLAFNRDAGQPPAERFARILANGPEYGVHVIVWCDSLASVQRGLGRRALRDFDARILFQMSAADSTELVDDDGASRLGLHTAILSEQGEGRRAKFRPFSLPDPQFIAQVGLALRTHFS